MTSQKALYCVYCYWLTRDKSATGQLLSILAYFIHITHLVLSFKLGRYMKKSQKNTLAGKTETFLSIVIIYYRTKISQCSQKISPEKLQHKPVKYFIVFILSQSHLLLLSQSESNPPGINRLLSHCAIFC